MRKFWPILWFCGLLWAGAEAHEQPSPEKKAVTYQLTGRLGNNLIAYLHAKWIAWKYDLPFLYKPFPYSDQYALHDREKHYYTVWHEKFKRQVNLVDLTLLKIAPNSTLFRVPYFRDDGPRAGISKKIFFRTEWNNPEFRSLVKTLLQPRFSMDTIKPPENMLSVLVHVRTGGGFDALHERLRFPDKFPPHSYYIEALRKLSKHFDHPPIYAYIMTDDPHVAEIAQHYKSALQGRSNIFFDYRKTATGPSVNVMEDFHSIPNFDCLIRGDSTFSIIATLLAHFKVIVRPKKCHVNNSEIIVDEIDFQVLEANEVY